MRTVWKYQMTISSGTMTEEFHIPAGSKFLHAELAEPIDAHNLLPRHVNLWFEVNTDNPTVIRQFAFIGTGFSLPDRSVYLATLNPVKDTLIIHLYETFQQ
jgi:hypothetical protein